MNLESPLWRRCYLHLRWYFYITFNFYHMITFTLIVLASKDNDQVSGLAALIRNAVMITSILGTGGNRPLYVGLLSGRRLSLLLGSGWVGSGGILRHILCKYADLHHAYICIHLNCRCGSTLQKQIHKNLLIS